jgi:hypothetical protein
MDAQQIGAHGGPSPQARTHPQTQDDQHQAGPELVLGMVQTMYIVSKIQ